MAKRKIIWSPEAKKELKEILKFYHKRNGNKIYSDKLNQEFRETTKHIHDYNSLGHPTDYENVRVITSGVYLIFYEVKKDTIEIFKVWDGRRNPEELNLK